MFGRFLKGVIRFYQVVVSPWTPPSCRYTPTCSDYSLQAIEVHGARRGGWMAVRRIFSCHPWGGQGFDPVPPARSSGPDEVTTTSGPQGRLTP